MLDLSDLLALSCNCHVNWRGLDVEPVQFDFEEKSTLLEFLQIYPQIH